VRFCADDGAEAVPEGALFSQLVAQPLSTSAININTVCLIAII
jgi:hypothetical protein